MVGKEVLVGDVECQVVEEETKTKVAAGVVA